MKNIKKTIIGTLIFIVILGVSFYLFTVRIDKLATQTIENRLIEVAESNAKSMKLMFEKDIQMLVDRAKFWQDEEALASPKSLKYLSDTGKNTDYVQVELDLPNGTGYTSDGDTVDVADMKYINKVLAGQTILACLSLSGTEVAPRLAIIVPVYKDGVIIAAMKGIYSSSFLMDIVNLRTFDGQGYFTLINSDGEFLIKSSKMQQLTQEDNIFDLLTKASFKNPSAFDKMQSSVAGQESGFVVYNLDGEDRCTYYTPVGIDQWYIISAVPMKYLLQQKMDINSSVILLLVVLILLFIFLAVYIVVQSRKAKALLRQDRDYLEHVLNNIPLPIFITNADRCLNFVNDSALCLFDCKRDIIGKQCSCFKTGICKTEECAIEKVERTGNNRTYYERDGLSYMVSTAILTNAPAAGGKYIEAIQDITEIVKIQRALEEKTLELETMSENLVGGILITALTEGFPVIRCNKNYAALLGYTEKQIVGNHAIQWVAPEDAEEMKATIHRQLEEDNYVFLEHRLLDKNGKKIWVSLHGKPTILQGERVGVWMLTDISDIREARLELKISEERYRIAMQNTEDIIIDYNLKANSMYHSPMAKQIYGVPEIITDVPESLLRSGTVFEESAADLRELFRKIHAGDPKCSCVLKARTADKRILWTRLLFTTIFDNDNAPVRAIGILRDITREKEAEFQYKRETRYRELTGKDGAFYYEADMTNRRFISGHELITRSYCTEITDDFDTIINLLVEYMVYAPDRHIVQDHISWDAVMSAHEAGITHMAFEYRRDLGGKPSWVECSLHSFKDEDSQCVNCIGCIKDINEAKQRELDLQDKAERDLLTGLYNKVTTELLIKNYIASTTESTPSGAFLLVDLDAFKLVNDTLGHAFGDSVLSEVSQKLLELFPGNNILGRIGGDEFVVFLCQTADEKSVIEKAEQICDMFHSTYIGENNNYKISGSIGIALFPAHGETFQDLYRNADRALYYSKGRGRDIYSMFIPPHVSDDLPTQEFPQTLN